MVAFQREELGARDGPALVFLAGFPDGPRSAWHPRILEEMARTHRVILLSLPKLCPEAVGRRNLFNILVEMLHDTLVNLGVAGEHKCAPLALVGHGIGSYVVMLYENAHAEEVDQLVLLDNGIRKTYLLSEIIYTFSYELLFAAIYTLHLHLSATLATVLLRAVLWASEWYRARHHSDRGGLHNALNVHSKACYVYSHLLAHRVTGEYLQPRFPHCPLLFVYGEKKRAMLHDDEFIWSIEAHGRAEPAASSSRSHVYLHHHLYEYERVSDTIRQVDRQHDNREDQDQDQDHTEGDERESVGGGGGLVSPSAGQPQSLPLRSRFRSVPEAGHYFTRTHPQVVVEELSRFLP